MFGAQNPDFSQAKPWQASVSWRYQRSDRHFRGSEEQEERQSEDSEVINTIHLLDFSLAYQRGPRWSIGLGMPYLLAERSNPIRDENREVIGRSESQARSVGDIIISAHRWMLDPETHPSTNWQIGFGLKLPTGPDNVNDRRTRYQDGEYVTTIETVDQSIQPGDGGFGLVLDLSWFQRVAQDRCAFYFTGTYLFNPEGKNGVYTYRSRESEEIMSIADQYLARVGLSVPVSPSKAWSLSLGGRIEGIPSEDVFGSSQGFRRPGYAVSVEPAVSWSRGDHALSLAVPAAVYRNRVRSVSDKQDGRHGDAAFADYLVLFGYSYRFGSSGRQASASQPPADSARTCEVPATEPAPSGLR